MLKFEKHGLAAWSVKISHPFYFHPLLALHSEPREGAKSCPRPTEEGKRKVLIERWEEFDQRRQGPHSK